MNALIYLIGFLCAVIAFLAVFMVIMSFRIVRFVRENADDRDYDLMNRLMATNFQEYETCKIAESRAAQPPPEFPPELPYNEVGE